MGYQLISAHGKYVCVGEDGSMSGSEALEEGCDLNVTYDGGTTVSVQSGLSAKYLSAQADGSVEWDREGGEGPWERVGVQLGPKGFCLRSCHGKYLCADADDCLVWDRAAAGPWECFTGSLPVVLSSFPGQFMSAQRDGTIEWDRTEVGPWEVFECHLSSSEDNATLTFKTCHGAYLCAERDGNLVADREEIGPWEQFQIVDDDASDGFLLKTFHGDILVAPDGNNLKFASEVLWSSGMSDEQQHEPSQNNIQSDNMLSERQVQAVVIEINEVIDLPFTTEQREGELIHKYVQRLNRHIGPALDCLVGPVYVTALRTALNEDIPLSERRAQIAALLTGELSDPLSQGLNARVHTSLLPEAIEGHVLKVVTDKIISEFVEWVVGEVDERITQSLSKQG